jgi:hypothetical protein
MHDAPYAISEHLEFKKILGGHAPRPPVLRTLYASHTSASPPLKTQNLPPLVTFLEKTLNGIGNAPREPIVTIEKFADQACVDRVASCCLNCTCVRDFYSP